MKKYIIEWDAGYGKDYDIIEAETHAEAEQKAYESWREECESNANYGAQEWTEELEEELM